MSAKSGVTLRVLMHKFTTTANLSGQEVTLVFIENPPEILGDPIQVDETSAVNTEFTFQPSTLRELPPYIFGAASYIVTEEILAAARASAREDFDLFTVGPKVVDKATGRLMGYQYIERKDTPPAPVAEAATQEVNIVPAPT